MQYSICDNLNANAYEDAVWCQVSANQCTTILFGIIYRSPSSSAENNAKLISMLQRISAVKSTCKIIAGDFKDPSIDWDSLIYTQIHDAFVETILDLHLTQIVLKNTREDAILDLIFSSDPEVFLNVDIIEPLRSSDHNMILAELDLMPILHRENHMPSRDYQKANWLDYQYLLSVVDWRNIFEYTDVGVVWNNFCSCLNQIMDLLIPLKKHSHRNKPLWEIADVRLARAHRNKAERTYLADRTPGNKLLRNEAAKNLKNSIHHAVTNFELLLANNQDAKPFWHYVKSKQKSKNSIGPLVKDKIGNVTEDAAQCAELLSDFFLQFY